MSVAEQRAFFKSIRDRQFAPVYYVHGEDDFLKEDAVKQLVAAVVDPATRDFNFEVRRGNEVDAGTLASLLDTPPMMAERRMLVVRDVGALKKDARAALDRYLTRPSADTVVALVTMGDAKADKKLENAAGIAVCFDPLTEDRVPKWIEHQAKELGATIGERAVALLHEAVGNDLPALRAELDKLASYAAGREIDEDAVTAIVGVRHGETLGDLLDAVLDRDAARAIDLLPHVLQQPKTNAVTITMALATQMLAVAWARALRDRGAPMGQMYNELFTLLKESGGAFTGRSWGDAVKAWTRGVERWTTPQLDRALSLLLATDCALKESRLSSDEQALATLVLSLCGLATQRSAAA
ncbi:MAG: DNA polymerase III subunit delta [Gemmatimonadaceae bacterium]|nr:DNA polymerase III subunit delta [Gemmatimonadaceae bacterium]